MRSTAMTLTASLLAVFSMLFVYASLAPKPFDAAAPLDPVRYLAAEEAKIRDAQIDPDSVRFRGDFVSRKGPKPVVCGEINYKNSLGGYVGYTQFIWGPGIALFGAETPADEMKLQWDARCAKQ